MTFDEWLQPDTVAILKAAVFYGIPKYGHATCYKQIEAIGHPPQRVTINDFDANVMRCIECGELLVPKNKETANIAASGSLHVHKKRRCVH